ncbi:MAG: hypothetical protein IJK81_06985 [Selenomonadaceae bacterium]|nr:hypothetical protein [Selenomonadaceae bacterium]
MANSIKLGFGYTNTDFTRQYTINNVADSIVSSSAAKEAIRTNVKAINASLAAGTDGGLSTMFRADDYDAAESIGAFNHINDVTIVEKEITELDIGAQEEGD